jgi:hypothetical protein
MFPRENYSPARDFVSNISHSLSSSSHNKVEPLVCLTGAQAPEPVCLSLSPHPLSYGVGSTCLKLEERHGLHAWSLKNGTRTPTLGAHLKNDTRTPIASSGDWRWVHPHLLFLNLHGFHCLKLSQRTLVAQIHRRTFPHQSSVSRWSALHRSVVTSSSSRLHRSGLPLCIASLFAVEPSSAVAVPLPRWNERSELTERTNRPLTWSFLFF